MLILTLLNIRYEEGKWRRQTWITGPADPRGPPDPEGPLPVYFQVTSSRIRLLSSGMYFLSQAQQWTCWSVGEIMKKLKVRPEVIKTRQQKNDQEAVGSQLESKQRTECGQWSHSFQGRTQEYILLGHTTSGQSKVLASC